MSRLITIYEQYLSECNARRFDAASSFLHDNIEVNGRSLGASQFGQVLAGLIETVPDFRWELIDHVTNGEKLAARIRTTGTPRAEWMGIAPNGKAVSVTELVFYTFKDEKIAEIWVLFDLPALKAQMA